jgi:excisionase family DNA binding protein
MRKSNGTPARDLDQLMTVAELADYLNLSTGGVYNMIADITAADGKIMLRGHYRFVRRTVVARLEAGLFGRGLDENGAKSTRRE